MRHSREHPDGLRLDAADTASDYIDKRALSALLVDMSGDGESTRRFIEDFVSLWETRAQRLTDALLWGALDAAHVVLLSIRSSACMLGAAPLEAAARRMLAAVQERDLAACSAQIALLLEVGRNSCSALTALLRNNPLAPI